MDTPAPKPSRYIRAEPGLSPVCPAAMYVCRSEKYCQSVFDEYASRRPVHPLNVRHPYPAEIVNVVKNLVPCAYLFNGRLAEQVLQQLARAVVEKVTRVMRDTIIH